MPGSAVPMHLMQVWRERIEVGVCRSGLFDILGEGNCCINVSFLQKEELEQFPFMLLNMQITVWLIQNSRIYEIARKKVGEKKRELKKGEKR